LANAIKDAEITIDDAFPPPAIREVQRKTDPKPAAATSQGQSLVDALDQSKGPAPAPTPLEPPSTKGNGYLPDAAYTLTKVHQPNPAKAYHLMETSAGVTFHAWSTTVIGHAKAALAAQIPVRLVAEPVNFAPAPWRVVKLEPATEPREPGEEG
jgi:hypothetical protein